MKSTISCPTWWRTLAQKPTSCPSSSTYCLSEMTITSGKGFISFLAWWHHCTVLHAAAIPRFCDPSGLKNQSQNADIAHKQFKYIFLISSGVGQRRTSVQVLLGGWGTILVKKCQTRDGRAQSWDRRIPQNLVKHGGGTRASFNCEIPKVITLF